MIAFLALFALSLAFCWTARPQAGAEWSGESAADLASGLIIAMAAGGGLFETMTGNGAAMTLLSGLAWYAAMPLVVLVRLAQAGTIIGAPCAWTRETWGRILLVQCVIFELARRSELTYLIPQIALIVGLIALSVWAIRPLASGVSLLARLSVPALWGAIAVGYFIYFPDSPYVLSAPIAVLLLQAQIRSHTHDSPPTSDIQ